MSYCQKKIGKYLVTITYDGNISIVDDFYSNYGSIYPHNIENLKNNIKNPITGHYYQVIGLDKEPTKTVTKWIYSRIKSGKFDHLIPKF